LHDASLNARASLTSVLRPRAPTPSDGASVAATTRTWCPAATAHPTIPNASAHVSRITRLGSSFLKYPASARVRTRLSSTIAPSLLRRQICDSFPPISIATCSTVGLLACAHERVHV